MGKFLNLLKVNNSYPRELLYVSNDVIGVEMLCKFYKVIKKHAVIINGIFSKIFLTTSALRLLPLSALAVATAL